MKRLAIVALAGGALFVLGCSGIRYVKRTQDGGVIALQGDREGAMEKARKAMAEHCQGPYTVVEEGEVVIGEDSAAAAETHNTRRGGEVTRANSSTRQATEWRVTYVCGVASATPPPDPGMSGGGGGEVPPGEQPGTP
jgi:hypothetical protein